jgi:hypothetical protein
MFKEYYMHLINKEPGVFCKGMDNEGNRLENEGQICYVCSANSGLVLCDSLEQIFKEQKLTKEYREKGKCSIKHEYSYMVVKLPT